MKGAHSPWIMGEDLHATLLRWLNEEQLNPKPQDDERALVHWLVRYPPGPNGHAFNIVHPKGRDLIAISSMTRVDAGQQKEMKEHSKADIEQWQDWVHSIRLSLIDGGVDWGIHVGGDKSKGDGPLQAFNVSEPIWLDGLSKNNLMQALRRLWLAKLGVIHEIKHNYGAGSGEPGPVDDFERKKKEMTREKSKSKSSPKQKDSEVEMDDSGSFGSSFDKSEWA
jgi:hypothetical protein